MFKVSHKKSYLICVELQISKYYVIFQAAVSALLPVSVSQFCTLRKKNQNKDYIIFGDSTYIK